uniref:Uncharacterized protein n=1 Tax=Physcomitrium patens TaxID=3218 RepID=A0A2K1K607_PHYPA|nr:hypothetical protein PHYPA_011104 [Physcomitrium patens]
MQKVVDNSSGVVMKKKRAHC